MKVSRTNSLIQDMNKTFSLSFEIQNPQKLLMPLTSRASFFSRKLNQKSKISQQKQESIVKYKQLTNMTKQQQKQKIWPTIRKNNKNNWTYKYYQGNNKIPNIQKTFNILESNPIQPFPHNNKKYNIQFLQRSLHGTNLKFPKSQTGQFRKVSNSLYSKRFEPIVQAKIKFNQDWQLRQSLFGKTQIDRRRDNIIEDYEIQTKPFRTPKSNQLISSMGKGIHYY